MKFINVIPTIIIACLLFLGGYIYGVHVSKSSNVLQTNNTTSSSIDLIIDYGDGSIKTFPDIEVSQGSTAWDVLTKIERQGSVSLEYDMYGEDMGVFLKGIDGIGTDITTDNSWWHYWVNAEYALTGLSGYKVQNGDVVLLIYTKAQE